uniref:Uncharacterized protein n=1 Tax=Arundo donax TaxID=35708 RepID=A0A0A8ZXL6_ARUDO
MVLQVFEFKLHFQQWYVPDI